jgi:PqqD family protein of HPr-rel-A system
VLSRTGDEAVLIDEKRGRVHVLNHTAAEVWQLCEGGATARELTGGLADVYGLDAGSSSVHDDVEQILATFRELGLVVPDPALVDPVA